MRCKVMFTVSTLQLEYKMPVDEFVTNRTLHWQSLLHCCHLRSEMNQTLSRRYCCWYCKGFQMMVSLLWLLLCHIHCHPSCWQFHKQEMTSSPCLSKSVRTCLHSLSFPQCYSLMLCEYCLPYQPCIPPMLHECVPWKAYSSTYLRDELYLCSHLV